MTATTNSPEQKPQNHQTSTPPPSSEKEEKLPYWQVNVPPHLRTETCPDFLRDVSPKDRGILSTPDSSYRLDTWEDVRERVRRNQLDRFQRVPSELRRYLAFTWRLRKEYGSVMRYVLEKRLGWREPVVASGKGPFEDESDFKVLRNDWPYGVDPKIVHLVVWTKFPLEEDPKTEDLTDQARAQIDAWVNKVFVERVGKDRVGIAFLPSSFSGRVSRLDEARPGPRYACECANGR
mgnify:CR=1 FL=1